MISVLEIRRLIENSCLPLVCCCTEEGEGLLTLRIYDPYNSRLELILQGLPRDELKGGHGISRFVEALRSELKVGQDRVVQLHRRL